jgi:predicted nuclease of predicted toxin-antitoxin system
MKPFIFSDVCFISVYLRASAANCRIWVNGAGHDAKTVNDQQLKGATDPALIKVCNAEDRVLVTLDTDFSDIRAYPPEEYSGIIILRVANQAKPYLTDILSRTIPLIGKEPLKHL